MASLKDLTKNLFAKTEIDDELRKRLRGVSDFLSKGVQNVRSQPASSRFLYNPQTFAKVVRSGANALNFVSNYQTRPQNNPVLRSLESAGKTIVGNAGQGLQAVATGIEQKKPLKFAAGTLRPFLPIIGAYAGPAYSLGGIVIGGGLGALTSKDKATGFGKGAVEGLKTAAVTRYTDPLITKGLSTLAPGVSPLARQLIRRVASGGANVAEDEIINKINEYKSTSPEKALSFFIGAAISGNDELVDFAKSALRKSKSEQKKAVETIIKQTKLEKQLQKQYGGKTPPGYRSVAGSNQYVNYIKPIRFPSELKRAGEGVRLIPTDKPNTFRVDTGRSRLRKLEDLNAVGAVAGFEQDEDGKWHYNPGRGALGIGIATLGTKATKGADIPSSSPKETRTDLDQVNNLTDTTKLSRQRVGGVTTPTKGAEVVSSSSSISKKGKLNLKNLAIDNAGRKALQEVNKSLPTSVISNRSVIDKARTAKGTGTLTDEKMRDLLAQQLKNRQKVVDLSIQFSKAKKSGASEEELAKIMLEISQQSRTAQQGGTFAGRLLQAQRIVADRSATPMQRVLALLDNAGVKEDKYLKDAIKVNWEDPVEVVKFYRKYVPPSLGEVLTEIRYSNMLSSPLTQITNAVTNFLGTGLVAPVEKTITGTLDAFRSALTGKERKYYASAGIEYAKGYVASLPQALKKAWNILSQKEISVKPDMEYVPSGVGGPLGAYTTPLRALEAMDQFFKTLVEGGVTRELKAGPQNLSATKIAKAANEEATYRLFRQSFDPSGKLGQGYVLRVFDMYNSAILNIRRLPGGKWILPFLQTPANILKQGIEYSPLGITTIPGSKKPLEQLSKTIVGSAVFLTAYQLAKSGLTTWSPPAGEKERELYYAAGLQPYSVKIGGKWVSYSKLGPLAYPIAMAAALAEAEKTKPDQSRIKVVSESIGGILSFFSDQSYVKNIGDLVDAIRGGVRVVPNAISSQAANLTGQLIPYKSFLTWLGRITDPTYRKAKSFNERLIKDIPVIGSSLDPYTDPMGRPSRRDLPLINAFSPVKISIEKQPAEREYRLYEKGRIQRGIEKRSGERLLEDGGSTVTSTGKYQYVDDEGSVKTIDLGKVLSMPEDSAMNREKKDREKWKLADDILTSKLAPNLQAQALEKLGVDKEQVQYYSIAKETNDLKYLYVEEEIGKILSTSKDRQAMLQFLIEQRRNVGGKMILTSGVIDDLREAGYITKAEADKLKAIDYENGEVKLRSSGGGEKGGVSVNIKTIAPKGFKFTKSPITLPSTSIIKLKPAPKLTIRRKVAPTLKY